MSKITSYSTDYQTFPALFELEPVAGKKVTADFSAPELSSLGGLPLVREYEKSSNRISGPARSRDFALQSRKETPGGGRTSGAAEHQRDVADIEAAESPGGGLPSRLAPERGCHEVTGVEKARLRSKRRGSGICPVNIVPRMRLELTRTLLPKGF